MTDTQGARFALDESKAREWIAADIAANEAGGSSAVDIGSRWTPAEQHDGIDAGNLLYEAWQAGLIWRPNGVYALDYEYSDDSDGGGYRWLLTMNGPDGTDPLDRSMILASPYSEAHKVPFGEEDSMPRGADAAVMMLSEAVDAANSLLDDLDRYVSSLPLAARAPEIAELVAQLPAGEWGADELATLGNWLGGHGYDTGSEDE